MLMCLCVCVCVCSKRHVHAHYSCLPCLVTRLFQLVRAQEAVRTLMTAGPLLPQAQAQAALLWT